MPLSPAAVTLEEVKSFIRMENAASGRPVPASRKGDKHRTETVKLAIEGGAKRSVLGGAPAGTQQQTQPPVTPAGTAGAKPALSPSGKPRMLSKDLRRMPVGGGGGAAGAGSSAAATGSAGAGTGTGTGTGTQPSPPSPTPPSLADAEAVRGSVRDLWDAEERKEDNGSVAKALAADGPSPPSAGFGFSIVTSSALVVPTIDSVVVKTEPSGDRLFAVSGNHFRAPLAVGFGGRDFPATIVRDGVGATCAIPRASWDAAMLGRGGIPPEITVIGGGSRSEPTNRVEYTGAPGVWSVSIGGDAEIDAAAAADEQQQQGEGKGKGHVTLCVRGVNLDLAASLGCEAQIVGIDSAISGDQVKPGPRNSILITAVPRTEIEGRRLLVRVAVAGVWSSDFYRDFSKNDDDDNNRDSNNNDNDNDNDNNKKESSDAGAATSSPPSSPKAKSGAPMVFSIGGTTTFVEPVVQQIAVRTIGAGGDREVSVIGNYLGLPAEITLNRVAGENVKLVRDGVSLSCTIPGDKFSLAPAGSADVCMVKCSGVSSVPYTDGVEFIDPPVVWSVSVAGGAETEDWALEARGVHFLPGSARGAALVVDGAPHAGEVLSDNVLRATVPAAALRGKTTTMAVIVGGVRSTDFLRDFAPEDTTTTTSSSAVDL
jgi:hypothetical protein